MTDNELDFLANLSGSAAKLLLYVLLSGSLEGDVRLHMRKSGVNNKANYYRSRGELLEKNLLDSHLRPVSKMVLGVSKMVPAETEPVSKMVPVVSKMVLDETPVVSKMVPEETDEELSWIEQAEAADALPSDGKPGQRGTNWQKRRTEQVNVLQSCWEEFFPQSPPLQRERAVRFLQLTQQCAFEVVAVFEYARGRAKPGPGITNYIETVLKDPNRFASTKPKAKPKVEDEEEGVSQEWLDALAAFDPKEVGWEDDE